MTRTKTYPIALALLALALSSQAQAVSFFTVIGSETKTTLSLLFTISEAHGNELPAKAWSSVNNVYQDESEDFPTSKLMYWDLKFVYDAIAKAVRFDAFHKIDPHDDSEKPGAVFVWNVARPEATELTKHGGLTGSESKPGYLKHLDSEGAHSDEYLARITYTTNDVDLTGDRARTDVLKFAITAEHRLKPVPDLGHTASFLLLALIPFLAARRFHLRAAPSRHTAR